MFTKKLLNDLKILSSKILYYSSFSPLFLLFKRPPLAGLGTVLTHGDMDQVRIFYFFSFQFFNSVWLHCYRIAIFITCICSALNDAQVI